MSKKSAVLSLSLLLVVFGFARVWYAREHRPPGDRLAVPSTTVVGRGAPRLLPVQRAPSPEASPAVPNNHGRPAPVGFQSQLSPVLAERVLRKVGTLTSYEAVQSFLQLMKTQAAGSPVGNLSLIEGLTAIRMLRSERDPEFLDAMELEFVSDMSRLAMQHQTPGPGDTELGPEPGGYFRTAREDPAASVAHAGIARDYLREISQYVPLPAPGDE